MRETAMDRQTGGEADWPGRGALYDLAGCLRFYSRLPVSQLPGEPDPHRSPDFTTLPRMLPLAGLVLALPAALVLAAAWWIGLGPFLAATLAVATLVVATGALHEDGLADVADGFGGGATRERRLEIMRDSRIGTYGGAALVLSLALRIGALATLLDRTGMAAVTALILSAALSRVAALAPMVLLAPARPGGLSASVGRPSQASLATALGLGLALGLAACLLGLPFGGVALMILSAGLAAWGLTWLARHKIGGQTGDVIGACQQVAEIAALVALVAAVAD
jgi:adenosylcobinamide-GDP ribazoletransferase